MTTQTAPARCWTVHTGNACPVPADALVAVDLGDGAAHVDLAAAWCWGAGAGPDGEGRILRWARMRAPSLHS